ncbi:hypothetical protein C8R30_10945 [Nitrosomonas nitrosa]|uniref:Uncharacterized protein n=1 Tax=Nitrosomonas nitrosa TaxID=52442 RepID=A0A1I4RPP6_9PROT|nr:hypothetical protein C8R30_10945 [Nitrosomonas nitrosa]SFM54164.1 hypothetical protein SAMN05421880_12031 [Nitrosomonas nitrosa]
MNKIKDKLTSSVRQAKATLQPKPENVISEDQLPAETTLDKPSTEKRAPASVGSVRESSGELFPDRVWPD